jgi:hypothetical protein
MANTAITTPTLVKKHGIANSRAIDLPLSYSRSIIAVEPRLPPTYATADRPLVVDSSCEYKSTIRQFQEKLTTRQLLF